MLNSHKFEAENFSDLPLNCQNSSMFTPANIFCYMMCVCVCVCVSVCVCVCHCPVDCELYGCTLYALSAVYIIVLYGTVCSFNL